MEGYGFAETMETIYAPNLYMIYALKAYAKALRCYLLIETLLQQMLFSKVRAEKKKITDNSFVEISQSFSHMFESAVDHFDGHPLQSENLQH